MMTRPRSAACIGGGVIGGGWAARFLLSGIDVALYDPHPRAEPMVREVIANAGRALARLTDAPLPPRGRMRFAASVAEAVAGADWIQESVPERLDLKRAVLNEIDAAAGAEAIIASSTSGLLPTALQEGMGAPHRFLVAHPYNPVYLLPLVELVGGARTDTRTIESAQTALSGIGMKGVPIPKEIDAFVGDRLLEALWREALWLIKDDICDVETLDDVIRYSFGLRWAQMGLFQTYRIAGGEMGMRHFLSQFGPALRWPWSRLTDVPELDAALIEKIGAQSDAQAGGLNLRELERIRDDNLVGILHALSVGNNGRGWGAGALLREFENRLRADNTHRTRAGHDMTQPLRLVETRVPAHWIDDNGHMTAHRYLQVFGEADEALLGLIGAHGASVKTAGRYTTVESHLRHLGEARLGDGLVATCQVLHADEMRLHVFHRIHCTAREETIATAEQMLLHVNKATGRAGPAPEEVLRILRPIAEAHAALPCPVGTGRRIGERRS